MQRLIIFLIRTRLGLKPRQPFRFVNQKSKTDYYYFNDKQLMKVVNHDYTIPSEVSLNWILDKDCKIVILNF